MPPAATATAKTETAKNVTNTASAQKAPEPTKTPDAGASKLATERVKKITSKMFKSIALGKENGVKIAGVVRAIKKKPSVLDSSKEFCSFQGDFRLQMGDTIYVSHELILPQYPESVIENGFARAFEAETEGVAPSVTFGMLVYREEDKDPKNARGFQWALQELHAIAPVSLQNDPLLKLLA